MERKLGTIRTASWKSKEFGQRVVTDFGTMVLGYCSIPSNIWSRRAFVRERGHCFSSGNPPDTKLQLISTAVPCVPPCALDGFTVFVYFGNLPRFARGAGHVTFRPCAFAPQLSNAGYDDDHREVISARRKRKADFLARLIEEGSTRGSK